MNTRPERWPDPDHPLLVAARSLDARIDGGEPIADVVADVGLDIEAVTHLVHQRVRGLGLTDLGDGAAAAAAMLDGICIGWEARRLSAGAFGIGKAAADVETETTTS